MVLPLCLTTIGKRGTGPAKKRELREMRRMAAFPGKEERVRSRDQISTINKDEERNWCLTEFFSQGLKRVEADK